MILRHDYSVVGKLENVMGANRKKSSKEDRLLIEKRRANNETDSLQ
ncbi:hypothetical protein HMPREF9996_00181 [Aggregatibacter actinomycetemcomitans Y4]|nr:hypothetical protein HMPREF9996_00181 [Aggregatibacter actinomycetemcomitans Y4]KYK77707.1 hypothetical protein SA2876_05225 [Aggregatibacter actinomycetemcomitans serotype e str. SA2876]